MTTTKKWMAITVAALAVACGRTQSTASSAPAVNAAAAQSERPHADIDPCTLVTREMVAAMFGEIKEGPTKLSGLRNESQCEYINMAGSWLKFSAYSGSDRWEMDRNLTNAQNPRDLSSIGDEAFIIKRGTDSVVYARRGESILELSCSCDSALAEKLARAAAERL